MLKVQHSTRMDDMTLLCENPVWLGTDYMSLDFTFQ